MNLRVDRLVTLYLASPWTRIVPNGHFSIPVLMYHSIVDEDESRVSAYYRTSTSPAAFAAQMHYLRAKGYHTCGLEEVISRVANARRDVERCVAITFDDGYRDFYENACPVLNECGFMATVFLPTAYIAESALQFKGRECLTWAQVRELQKCGIVFGSHTVTHPQLRDLDRNSIDRELVESKREIEQKTGYRVNSFAYPYAFPQTEAKVKKVLRESLCGAGYENGVCTVIGSVRDVSDPLFLERLPVNSFDDVELFQAKLNGAYDWMNGPQKALKAAKSAFARICKPQ